MVDLISKRYYFFALSLIIIIAGLVAFLFKGVELDIQFQGGTILQLQLNEDKLKEKDGRVDPVQAQEITAKAQQVVKNVTGKNTLAHISSTINTKDSSKKLHLLVLDIASKEELTKEEQNSLVDTLRQEFEIKPGAEMNVNVVAPFIGKEIRDNGIKATLLASLLIVLYVWLRFRVMSGLSAGVMAVLALFHDIALMFCVYVIFRIPLNDTFIAAILTILGYSINDNIIIYDRIRENSNLLRRVPIRELVNKSIIQTLSRTINTTVTVLIAIITVYIFAHVNNIASIKQFSFPLIIGVISGCYSSIFIASPLWVMWKEAQARKKLATKAVKS